MMVVTIKDQRPVRFGIYAIYIHVYIDTKYTERRSSILAKRYNG